VEDTADMLNNYFASVFTSEDTSSIPEPISMNSDAHIYDLQFTESDVLRVLSRLWIDKTAGPDELSPRFLLQVKEFIAYPLYILYRKCTDKGFVPANWKLANVSPIFKKGNRHKAENYRPVSLTCQLSKIFETIIRDALVQYLESHNVYRHVMK